MAVRWGILGTGYIAELFVHDLVSTGHEVAAVGSRSESSSRAFASRFGIPVAHGDYASLCADPGVDAVYIATPNPFHAEHALLALRAGKHALVEKPFTMTTDAAQTVIAEAASRGLVVMEAMWTRFLPHMVRAREIVREGTIGVPRAVEANLSQAFTAEPTHRLNDPALGGGALFDLGVYVVSLAVDFLGAPREWHAIVEPAPTGVDGQASIVLGFESGAQAALHIGMDHRGAMTASVLGTKGRIDIHPAWHRASSLTVTDNEGVVVEEFAPAVEHRGMQYEAGAFEQLIERGATNSDVMPHSETLDVTTVIADLHSRFMRDHPATETDGAAS